MKWGAHVSVAAGMAAIALGELTRLAPSRATPITIFLVFVGGILAAQLGAILPDVIDFIVRGAGVKHRNVATHGVFSAAIPVIVSLALSWAIIVYLPAFSCLILGIAMGSGMGWGTHLLLDALTPAGIPLRGRQSTWRWASYDSPSANRVLKVFGGTCLLTGILTLLDPVYPLFVPLLVALWMSRWKADRVRRSDACLLALTRENAEVVATLTAISVIFQRRGDHGRSLAYQRAARAIKDYREPISTKRAGGTLTDIPFVGKKIAGVIEDLLQNGHSQYLNYLQGAPSIVQ